MFLQFKNTLDVFVTFQRMKIFLAMEELKHCFMLRSLMLHEIEREYESAILA